MATHVLGFVSTNHEGGVSGGFSSDSIYVGPWMHTAACVKSELLIGQRERAVLPSCATAQIALGTPVEFGLPESSSVRALVPSLGLPYLTAN